MIEQDESRTNLPEQSGGVSRRRLLQALAAGGAAVWLEHLLPLRWITPEVAAGPLLDPPPEISDLQAYWRLNYGSGLFNGTLRFRYADNYSEILPNSGIFSFGTPFQGVIANGETAAGIGGDFIPTNATHGTIRYPLPVPLVNGASEVYDAWVESAIAPGRYSNQLNEQFYALDYGQVNISDLRVIPTNEMSSGGECSAFAYMRYNGTLPEMFHEYTRVYMVRNESDWIAPGVDLLSANALPIPDDPYGGALLVPVPGAFNHDTVFDLRLFLEDDDFPYESNQQTSTFLGCAAPIVYGMSYLACGPAVGQGIIGCSVSLTLQCYDLYQKLSGSSRLTILYGSQLLIDDRTLDELGVIVDDPAEVELLVPLVVPAIGQGMIHVQLTNDDGIKSLMNSWPLTTTCTPDLPLVLNTTAVRPLNTANQFRVEAFYNDSAGLLTNTSLLTAFLNTSLGLKLLFNATPISNAGGAVIPNDSYSFLPPFGQNCTAIPINGSTGTLDFLVNANGGMQQTAADEEVLLSWFLTEPDGRDSSAQFVQLQLNDSQSFGWFMPAVARP